jgi:hypothetical protein
MTTQAKKYIAPDDIVAIRLDCTNPKCRGSISLPISVNIRVEKLLSCPLCNEPWLRLPNGSTAEYEVQQCIVGIERLSAVLSGKHYPGLSLALEIKDEESARLPETQI